MLADLRQRIWKASSPPRQAWPETDGPPVIALARRDPESQTVSLILDATTASTAIFALAGHADEREAHLREVQRHAQNLPEGSYGRQNRQAIAARETRIATRLRAVEQAYRMAIERDTAYAPPEPRGLRLPGMWPTWRSSRDPAGRPGLPPSRAGLPGTRREEPEPDPEAGP